MLNVGYQKRDFDFFNYDLYTLTDPQTKKPFILRGPALPTLEPGAYFSSIGSAFTYGCYTHHPYTQMIADELKFPGINLGIQGAGPCYYLNPDNRLLLDIVNRSKFAIVAVMSGRSVSNSLFEVSLKSQEKLRMVGEKNYQPAHKLYNWLLENHDREYIKEIIAETRDNFVKEYIELLTQIKVPKILLWFSKREPEYQEKYDDEVWQLLGKFPHLVNRQMMDSIKEHSDEYVECVTGVGTPQILFNRFSGQPGIVKKDPGYGYSSSNYNMYYASPEMHLDAANQLLKPCGKYINSQDKHPDFIQARELVKNLGELHFAEFLLSTESTDSVVISELEVKNYLFEKHDKVFNNLVLSDNAVYLPKTTDTSTNFIDLTFNCRHKLKLKEQLSTQKYFDLVDDVLPFLISKPSKVKIDHLIETKDRASNPSNLFAIVCTPRSGSSFLCDLLKLNGAGKPLEHLRSPLLYLIKHRRRLNIDLKSLLQKVIARCCDRGMFGTKVISHFFFDLVEILDRDEMEDLMSVFRNFKIIYLYRENKTAQAVSKFLASKSKFWHSTAPHRSLAEYQEQVQSIEYNFETIKEIYEKLVEEEQGLEDFIDRSGFNQIIKVDYEQLKEKPQAEMEKIVKFLNIELDSLNLESDFKVLASTHSEELIAKFQQEYSQYSRQTVEQLTV